MASIRRRGATWQVQVRRHGLRPLTRTFRLKSDAELWGRQREAELDRGDLPVDHRALRSLSLSNLLERYRDTVTPRKRGAAQERYKLRILLAHPIAQQSLERLSAAEVAAYRDERLSVVTAGTVRRELAVLQHCLEIARNEWGLGLPGNPLRQIELPPPSRGRERRATPQELTALLSACRCNRSAWLQTLIQMAVETGMRRGELLAMKWSDVDLTARKVHVTRTKNGYPRTVPLSTHARQTLGNLTQNGDRVFPVTANAVRLAWERLKRRAGVSGLRFHDLRHEAISRFFERGLNVPEVALISGHRDVRMLLRYTHPMNQNILKKLDGANGEPETPP
jgi:integrase